MTNEDRVLIEKRIDTLNHSLELNKRNTNKLKSQIRCLNKFLTAGDVTVSDHAILMYLQEFYKGVDMSGEITDFNELVNNIRTDIIRKNRDWISRNYGNCDIDYNNFTFKVQEYVVITILKRL